jgi:hypothetical protein
VGVVEEEGLVVAAPCKTDVLLVSMVCGAGGVVAVEDVYAAKGVVEGQDPEGDDLDGVIAGVQGVKEFLDLVYWRPCNSFSANIASWNKR